MFYHDRFSCARFRAVPGTGFPLWTPAKSGIPMAKNVHGFCHYSSQTTTTNNTKNSAVISLTLSICRRIHSERSITLLPRATSAHRISAGVKKTYAVTQQHEPHAQRLRPGLEGGQQGGQIHLPRAQEFSRSHQNSQQQHVHRQMPGMAFKYTANGVMVEFAQSHRELIADFSVFFAARRKKNRLSSAQ